MKRGSEVSAGIRTERAAIRTERAGVRIVSAGFSPRASKRINIQSVK